MSDFSTNAQMLRLAQHSAWVLRDGVASPTSEKPPNDS